MIIYMDEIYICDILWFSDKVWKYEKVFIFLWISRPFLPRTSACWQDGLSTNKPLLNNAIYSQLLSWTPDWEKVFLQCACIVWHIVWKCAEAADMARSFGAHYEKWQNPEYALLCYCWFSIFCLLFFPLFQIMVWQSDNLIVCQNIRPEKRFKIMHQKSK